MIYAEFLLYSSYFEQVMKTNFIVKLNSQGKYGNFPTCPVYMKSGISLTVLHQSHTCSIEAKKCLNRILSISQYLVFILIVTFEFWAGCICMQLKSLGTTHILPKSHLLQHLKLLAFPQCSTYSYTAIISNDIVIKTVK